MQCAYTVLYRLLWLVRLYHIFQHYFMNGTILENKIIDHKMCVWTFSAKFVCNVSHFKKDSARYHHKCKAAGA